MYIFGNAENLASRSPMWRSVLEDLKSRGCVGNAFPIACHQHQSSVQHISKPGQLPRAAPDGMDGSSHPQLQIAFLNALCRRMYKAMQ